MIEALLSTDDRDEFSRLFGEWWDSDIDKDRLVRRASALLGSRVCRDKYQRSAPHEFLGLAAGVQAGAWLAPEVRMDPIAQALWGAAENRLSNPFKIPAFDDEFGKAVQRPLIQSWDHSDVPAVHHAIASTAKDTSSETVASWLLSQTMTDALHLGHRLVYMAWSVRLTRWANWESGADLLLPAVHYALTAPHDSAAADWLSNLLAHNPVRQDHVIGDGDHLSHEQLTQLARLISVNDPGRFVNETLRMLSDRVSTRALFDGLLLAAARLIQCADPDDWHAPVHAFLYLESLNTILVDLEPAQKVEALLLGGLIAQSAAAEAENLDLMSPLLDIDSETEAGSLSVWPSLASAFDDYDVQASLKLLGAALQNGSEQSLSAFLVAYASRNDARLYFSHDMLLICATMLAYSRSASPMRSRLLAMLGQFLALSEKDNELWEIMTG